MADDYIAPPYMLSAESSDVETTWSLGTYTSADEIGKRSQTGDMMALLGGCQSTNGTAQRQRGARRLGLFLVALFAMLIGTCLSRGNGVYQSSYLRAALTTRPRLSHRHSNSR
jgi:hypothetical protein